MPRFARRMLALAAFEISAALCVLCVVAALIFFGAYIHMLSATIGETFDQLVSRVSLMPPSTGAVDATKGVALELLSADVEAIFIDGDHRVAIYRTNRSDPHPTIAIRSRGDLSGDPRVSGMTARPILGLATAFGLSTRLAHVGGLDILVKENDAVLMRTVRQMLPALAIALLAAIAFGTLIARLLTRQVLRPLVDVTGALDRFAQGDLTPQRVPVESSHELGSLAIAYNGAIAQMQHAFAERDRSNAAMRQFISDAGHQLRTPLTVVRGFIAVLRKGVLRSSADGARILEKMEEQSRIMGSLIEKLILLDLWESERRNARAEPIDVGQLVADLVGPIAEANPGRTVSVVARPGVLAQIDPSEFGHALTNLVDNALKYTIGPIEVRAGDEDGRATVSVADGGPGIAPADAAHVFDRFYRGGRRDIAGSGLGLAIARRAIERADGTLVLESAGGGSRFVIRLPIACQASGTMAATLKAGRPEPGVVS